VALLPVLFVLVLAGAVGVAAATVRRSPASSETTVAAARRHARLTSTAAVVLATAAAVGTVATGRLAGSGPGATAKTALLVPIAFGVVHTAVLALGELTWPRPSGQVRRARLVRRGLLDTAPRWLARLTAGALAAATLTLGLGILLADPDGRSVSVRAAGGRVGSTSSPFAGAGYGRPAALGLLALVAVSVAALWIVANRPAVATADDRIEAALRRASAHRVLRGAAAVVLVVTGGLLAVSAHAAAGAATGVAGTARANGLSVDGPIAVLPVLGNVLAVLGLLAALGGVVLLAVRAPGVPADRPAEPAPAAG
jgi:hypothetical protein